MERLHLYWSDPIYFWQLYDEGYEETLESCGISEEKGIYMVVGRSKIIYIGQTRQTFRERLRQHFNSPKWDCIKREVPSTSSNPFIKCAIIEEGYGEDRIDAVENLLIYVEMPPCCERHYATYTKQRPLEVVNLGNSWPLKDSYNTEDYS